jgi:hypothetical protein
VNYKANYLKGKHSWDNEVDLLLGFLNTADVGYRKNNYAVDIGNTTRWEWLAIQIFAEFDKDLKGNINLKFKYLLYANLQTLELNKIDHRLEAILKFKITRYLDVNLSGILVYDFDQDKDVQLSQTLGIGFAYTFKNYKHEE